MKTLIIDNFDSFTYNLYQYCAELGGNPEVFRNNEISIDDIIQKKYTHIIISPGPGTPVNPKDFGVCIDVLKHFSGKVPILGVCLGHQGIIFHFGGKVVRAPEPMHGKTSRIMINTNHPLFYGLPGEIEVMRYHSLIGERKSLPPELEIIAETLENADHSREKTIDSKNETELSREETNHSSKNTDHSSNSSKDFSKNTQNPKREPLIMGVTHKTKQVFGVQFHPESIGTPFGKHILKNFLSLIKESPEKKVKREKNKASQKNKSGKKSKLTEREAEQFIDDIVTEKLSDEHIEKLLRDLSERGESVEEIVGMAKGLRKHAVTFPKMNEQLMDTCGTGGSGLPRVNTSTAVALVLAAAGIKVAKHGNRAASGRVGSFDLLESLEISFEMSAEKIAENIMRTNIGFLFAPKFHPAMKKLVPIRKKIGIRTIFNILGPLVNPAKPAFHLLGTTQKTIAEKLREAMEELQYEHVIIVMGEDGLDEVTLTGKTFCYELNKGKKRKFTFSPEDIDIPKAKNFDSIRGGNLKKNTELFLLLLNGQAPKPLHDLLIVNSAFGLLVGGKVKSLKDGKKLAERTVRTGQAFKKLLELRGVIFAPRKFQTASFSSFK